MKKAKLMIGNNRQSGFTLIELMITIAILAILLSLAVPSFVSIIRTNQIVSQTNSLITTLALARSEATKRGQRITVCSRNGNVCAASTNWSSGWLVFFDSDGNGDFDASDKLLQMSPVSPQGVVVTATAKSITYQASGENFTPITISISKPGCGASEMRQITIASSGRASLAKVDCS